MLDELRQIAIFAKAIDHGSFRAAAKALRLSPSVVSHHIGQLEERLGTALLYRSTRKLSLTTDGKRLLAAAHVMLEAAEAGIQDISNQSNQPSGALKLTIPAVLAQSDLTSRVAEYALAYPQVQLEINYSDSKQDLINDGFDVAIRMTTSLEDSSFKAKKLYEINRCLVASPKYLESCQAVSSPDELGNLDWLELAPVWHKKLEFRSAGQCVQIQKPKSQISVNNAHALARIACSGAGVAIIPEFLIEADIDAGRLCQLLPDWKISPVSVFAVWPSNAPKDGLVKHFLDFLKPSVN